MRLLGLMLELKMQYFRKDSSAGKDWGQEEKGVTEDETVRGYHWLNGHEFEQTLGDSERQGSLACCSPWGHKEFDMTEWTTTTATFIKYFSSLQKCRNWESLSVLTRMLFGFQSSYLIIIYCQHLPLIWQMCYFLPLPTWIKKYGTVQPWVRLC